MVSTGGASQTVSSPAGEESGRGKNALKPGGWLVPGEEAWEIRDPRPASGFSLTRTIDAIEDGPPPAVALVALPVRLVTCQLFWLETTDEKAVPDLLKMQCERRALLHQDEVWRHRIVRSQDGRLLAQVLILQKTLPAGLEVEGDARFEALPRCLELPPRSVCLWRSLGTMVLAITDDKGVIYFQSLPHRLLTRECRRDVQSVVWTAAAQGWVESLETVTLLGRGMPGDDLEPLGLPVGRREELPFALPDEAMELTPGSVKNLRMVRGRQRRVRLAALALAAVYAVFLSFQIGAAALSSWSNSRLQAQLDALMPDVTRMQATARRLDALNPALDTKTYPLEILHRIMASLPETGVRLTRFEITGDRVQLAGESSTAREAFDFLHALQSAESLRYVSWEEPPQPVPLPNDTARFSIQGTIAGAYRDAEES